MPDDEDGIGVRNAGVCRRVGRVFFYCLLEILNRFLSIFRRAFAPVEPPFQIKLIGFRVGGVILFDFSCRRT